MDPYMLEPIPYMLEPMEVDCATEFSGHLMMAANHGVGEVQDLRQLAQTTYPKTHAYCRRQHRLSTLVRICLQYLYMPPDYWSPRRDLTRHQMIGWYEGWPAKCAKNASQVPSTADMKHCMIIINELFFAGSLKHVDFRWQPDATVLGNRVMGYAEALPDDDRFWARITMESNHYSSEDTSSERHRKNILDTLLHECVHVYLKMYACFTLGWGGPDLDLIGATAHGPAFASISFSICEFWARHLQKDKSSIELSLGVAESIVSEYSQSGVTWESEHIEMCPLSTRLWLHKLRNRGVAINNAIYAGIHFQNERVRALTGAYPDTVITASMFAMCRLKAIIDETRWERPLEEGELDWPARYTVEGLVERYD